MSKRSSLGYLPGGSKNFVETLRRCLEYIRDEHPTQQQLVQWFHEQYDSRRKKANPSYVRTVKSLELIEENNNKFSLNQISEGYLATRDNSVIFQQLDHNYVGISDILVIVLKGRSTKDEICSFLREKTQVNWKTKTQCQIRLDWLCSLNYVCQNGLTYIITSSGRKVVESETTEQEAPSHSELQKLLVQLGKNLNFFSIPEYHINGNKVDVVWIKREAENPYVAVEVQLRGNLQQALTTLTRARRKWNCIPILVTTYKQMSVAESLVNETFQEIIDHLLIWHWSQIEDMIQSKGQWDSQFEKAFRRSGRFFFRKTKYALSENGKKVLIPFLNWGSARANRLLANHFKTF